MKKVFIFLVLILVLASLGCNLPASGGVTPGVSPAAATDTSVPPTGEVIPPTETEPPLPPTETPTLTPEPPVIIPLTVSYLEGGDVYVWRDGGMSVRLTATGDVCDQHISLDAAVVLFQRGSDCYQSDLWAINTDGSDMRLLFSNADFDSLVPGQDNYLSHLEFIPGTTLVAFNTGYLFEGPGQPRNQDLQILDYVSGIHSVLLAPGAAGGTMDYAPDGTWVALVYGDHIDIMNPDGSNRRTAHTFPFVYTYSEWTYLPALTWSADSSAFRLAVPAQDPLGDPTAPSRIYEVRQDGSVMFIGEYVSVPVFNSFPHLSPNAERVLFVSAPGGGTTQTLHLNAQDSSFVSDIYTGTNLEAIGFSPDSMKFLFYENISSLWLGVVGGSPTLISGAGGIRAVRWADANRFLAVWTGGPTRTDLRLFSTDGSSITLTMALSGMNYDFTPRP